MNDAIEMPPLPTEAQVDDLVLDFVNDLRAAGFEPTVPLVAKMLSTITLATETLFIETHDPATRGHYRLADRRRRGIYEDHIDWRNLVRVQPQ
jgi:hypothetical protein